MLSGGGEDEDTSEAHLRGLLTDAMGDVGVAVAIHFSTKSQVEVVKAAPEETEMNAGSSQRKTRSLEHWITEQRESAGKEEGSSSAEREETSK